MGMKIALRHLESSHATQLNADRYVARKQTRIRGPIGHEVEILRTRTRTRTRNRTG